MIKQQRRLVYSLVLVHIISAAGLSLVVPFLPLYLKELNIQNSEAVNFWTGLIFTAPAVTMMLTAPIWGIIADKYGRKLMLIRATLGGAIVIVLMGLAPSVEWLVLLRAIQGVLTGYIAASNAIVGAEVSKEYAGQAFGWLRTGTWVGGGLGPLLGGLIADTIGFKASFWITGALLAGATVLVIVFVQTQSKPFYNKQANNTGWKLGFLLKNKQQQRLYSLSFLEQLGGSMIFPIIPLFLASIMRAGQAVASTTGLLIGLKSSFGSACAPWFGAKGDRIGHKQIVVGGAICLILLYMPQIFITASWQFVVLQTLCGIAGMALVPGVGALLAINLPPNSSGKGFGLDSAIGAAARSIGPMLSTTIATGWGLRAVFWVAIIIYSTIALIGLTIKQ